MTVDVNNPMTRLAGTYAEYIDTSVAKLTQANVTGFGIKELVCDKWCAHYCPVVVPCPVFDEPGFWSTYIFISSVPDVVKFIATLVCFGLVLFGCMFLYEAVLECTSRRKPTTAAQPVRASREPCVLKRSHDDSIRPRPANVGNFLSMYDLDGARSSSSVSAAAFNDPLPFAELDAVRDERKRRRDSYVKFVVESFERSVRINRVIFAVLHLVVTASAVYVVYLTADILDEMFKHQTSLLRDMFKAWVWSPSIYEQLIRNGITPISTIWFVLRYLYGVWGSICVIADVIPGVGHQCRVYRQSSAGYNPGDLIRQIEKAENVNACVDAVHVSAY